MKKYISIRKFSEKVSDIDNIRNRAIEEFRNHFKDRSFRSKLLHADNIKYFIYLYKNKPEKENIKITFHFGKYRVSEFKPNYTKRWDVFIKTTDFVDDVKFDKKTGSIIYDEALEDLEGDIVHEITHASQQINGALKYLGFWGTSKAEKEKELYGIHATKPTEQEAVFVEFIYFIQQKRFQKAFEKINYYNKYFRNFTFEDFVKKAYSIGISKSDIIKFQKFVVNEIFKKVKDFETELSEDNDLDFYVDLCLSTIKQVKILFSKREFEKYKQKVLDIINIKIKQYPDLKNNRSSYKDGLRLINDIKKL